MVVKFDLKMSFNINKNVEYHFLFLYGTTCFRTRQRCCFDAPGLIYAVGGLTCNGDSLSTVEMYDPATGHFLMHEKHKVMLVLSYDLKPLFSV